MKSIVLGFLYTLLLSFGVFENADALQPMPCVVGKFSSTGDQFWKSITLKITNNCTTPVDLQNAVITFQNQFDLETSFWGQFGPLAYPDNNLKIASQPNGNGTFLSTLSLHFPNYPGANSKLPPGGSFIINYGAPSDGFVQGTVKVNTGSPISVGSILLTNASSKPANVAQKYALVHLMVNGQKVTDVQLPWQGNQTVSGLAPATYTLTADNVIDSSGILYQGSVNPSTIQLSADQTAQATISYQQSQAAQNTVTFNVTGAPVSLTTLEATLTTNDPSGPVNVTIPLNNGSGTKAATLPNGVAYILSAKPVSGYSLSFSPQPLVSKPNVVETITLSPTAGGTPISINGQLKVVGTKLCNEQGEPIQLKGMSSHGLQWYADCLTPTSLDVLAKDFKADIIRLSLYVQEGGYETDPQGFTNEMNALIQEASDRGMYVIVDWHILTPGDPNYNLSRAQTFFTNIANANKGRKNLLYEIANEPNGVDWATIKSYADKLIPVIRTVDPNTVILIGTCGWSSLGLSDGRSSQDIIDAPVGFPNVMYTFHFYAASHKDEYLNELDRASDALPIFVSEFGTQTYTGDGENDFAMSDRYMELMASKKISWTNWNYSSDFRSGAIWKEGTCPNGPWVDSSLKASGVYIKNKIEN